LKPDLVRQRYLFSETVSPNWFTRHSQNGRLLDQQIQQRIASGLKAGDSVQRIAKDIKDLYIKINPNKTTQGAYSKALRIARTNTNRAFNAGITDGYIKNRQKLGDDLQLVKVSTFDNRTRNQSAGMDGDKANEQGLFRFPNGQLAMIGDSGQAKWDINNRGRAVQQFRNIESIEGIDQTITFEQWSKSKGLTKSKYGENYEF